MMQARAIRALAVGIGLGIIFAALALSPIGDTVEESVGLPWLFEVRGAVRPPQEVVIVTTDQRSANHLSLPASPREWPRSKHGQLIRKLEECRAAAVVFDLKFQRPQSPAEDEEFAQGIRAFGQVFLVKGRNRKDAKDAREIGPGGPIGSTKPEIEDLPLQKNLEESALGVAPFPLPRVESRVTQVWAFHDDDATLPAVALHGTVNDRWLKLLSDAGFQIGASSLDGTIPLSSELTHNLRLAFKNNPMFANSVRRRFQQEFSGEVGETAGTAMLDALIRLYEGPDNFYLNFYGPPGTVPTIPYYRLVSGDGPPVDCLDFRGKTVFVGLSELTKPVTEDHFPTVFDRDDGVHMSGVEIAATAFANMLNNEALQPAGPGLRALILFALGVVITVCSLMLPAGYALALAIAIAAGYAVAVQTAFNQSGTWLPLATPLVLLMPTAVVLGFASQNAFVRRQRQRMQRALGHYVPSKIAKTFADRAVEPTALRETVYATCLAADAEGFTTAAEGMMPDAAATYLNAYFEALAKPLKRHGAALTQFHADSMMCAWTEPKPDPEMRSKACRAAIEALEAIRAFNQQHAPLHLGVRFGLHAGRVFVGHAGADGHFIYGIVGDIANTASRIEQLNKRLGTRLLATEEVVSGIGDILVRPLGDYQFTGKRAAVSVVEVLCPVRDATMAQLSLCARFRLAVEAFREDRLEEAESAFREILRDYPDDGPARFYLDQRLPAVRDATVPANEPPIQ